MKRETRAYSGYTLNRDGIINRDIAGYSTDILAPKQ
jgi:hypothetical protein